MTVFIYLIGRQAAGRQADMQVGRLLFSLLFSCYFMLSHQQPVSHLRRWPSIKPTSALYLVFFVNSLDKSAA